MSFKPNISENDFPSYYKNYIQLAPDLPISEALLKSSKLFLSYFKNLSEEKASYRYTLGKWSLKEVLLHCVDTERVMAYRAMRFARNDKVELPGFDQDAFVEESLADKKSIKSLLDEYSSNRNASLSLFSGFDKNIANQSGIASKSRVTVKALGYIISGHELHHLNVCRTKYK